jgi:hypothetical protein
MPSPLKFAAALFCACMLLATSGFAADGEIWKHPVKDASSTAIDSTFAPMTAHKVVRGDFKQTKFIAQLNREFVSVGNFVIANKKGILWNTEKPFASQLAISETGMVQQNANGTRSEINAKDNVVFAQISKSNPLHIFGQHGKIASRIPRIFQQARKNLDSGPCPERAFCKENNPVDRVDRQHLAGTNQTSGRERKPPPVRTFKPQAQ